MEGKLIESLIEEETVKENKDYYRQNVPGYSFDYFSEDQISFIKSQAGCVIRRLGYGSNFISPENPIAKTDFFENDDNFEDSKKHEIDVIMKNTEEHDIKMRYDYVSLNYNQQKLVSSQAYHENIEKKVYKNFELNLEAEYIRMKGGIDYRPKLLIKKYKVKI